ncbi:hypothetical protein BOX15_Mlig002106g5 [Macrostomum lignano]|uniref:EGF-like domain-containing protein n=1 Tax=Macrostomum lignano TaxID=282301 RepID=A0A267EG63_9PLAT|nr:hypothetical protein BOX15_Mlig002106g5 [Macrostomum lignano]
MLVWLLFFTALTASTATAAAFAAPHDKDAIMVAMDNDTSLKFTACQSSRNRGLGLSLLTAPTLGRAAFSVAWQPVSTADGDGHTVLFSQPQLGRVQACELRTAGRASNPVGDLQLSTLVSGRGDNILIKVEVSRAVNASLGEGVCRFETSPGADSDGLADGSAHLLAVSAFDGCVRDEAGGGRHCFNNWSASGCAGYSQQLGALSRVRRATTCTPTDCKNGGICNNITASPPCICPLPYIPPYCSTASNYCSQLQPDLNITSLPVCINGTCLGVSLEPPYFNCSCSPGFEGVRCDKDINECSSKPCVNGICRDLLNNYSCSCYQGWEGRNCSVDIDDCNSSVCSVRDRCVDSNSTCSCASGWIGANCSAIDFCARRSCPNGSACVNMTPRTFECRAAATFSYSQASPSPSSSAWRLSPSDSLDEPLTAIVGLVRTRQALSSASNSSSDGSGRAPTLLSIRRADRLLSIALTPTGQLTASLDNRTATTVASLATGEFYRFNVTTEPNNPLELQVTSLSNDSKLWLAESSESLPNASLTLDSVAIATVGDGFKGCLDEVRLNGRLLPLSDWSQPAGEPGFVRYVDWPANGSAPQPPLIGCHGDPVCELKPLTACLNSGRCVDLWNYRECVCRPGFSGAACGSADCSVVPCAPAVAGVSTPVVVALSVLALLLVVVIIAVVLIKLARNRRSETGQYRPSKEETNHDGPPGLAVREADTELDDNIVLGNMQVARL